MTVSDAVRRFRQTGSNKRRPGQGRRRCTSARDDRFITSLVLRNRFTMAFQVSNELNEVRNVHVSERTVRRRLAEGKIRAFRPAPELLLRHRRARLHFARKYQDWTVEQWRQVLFTDESRVSLRGPDGRVGVYRRANERFAQCTITNTVGYQGGSIMVWGGISYEARTDLVVIDNGSLTAQRYLEDILEPHVMPFGPFIDEGFTLMHDNACPHVARIVTEYLDTVGIQRLPWPACSPDLNPIEHLWDNLKQRIGRRVPVPATLQELKIAAVEEWNNIPQAEIQDLINSVPRRLLEVIRARGGNTRY